MQAGRGHRVPGVGYSLMRATRLQLVSELVPDYWRS